MQAKEIAGAYYEGNRSERFRRENPSQYAYEARYWPHFVDLAIQSLVAVLKQPNVTKKVKDGIMAALIEQAEKSKSASALLVPQATLDPVEKEDRRLIDDNPQLIQSNTV